MWVRQKEKVLCLFERDSGETEFLVGEELRFSQSMEVHLVQDLQRHTRI